MMQNDFNPYVGPRPFERKKEDSERFFGRAQETDEIISLIFGHPVILVYAQSGAGKTSLFNASVAPKLEENGFDVLPLTRVGGVLPKGIALQEIDNLYVFNALLKMGTDTDPRTLLSSSLSVFLQKYDRTSDEIDQPRPRVIIFDQFEELFTYTPERWREQREGFFLQVVEALEADPLLRVVFVIREDFLAELDPYARSLPERLRSRYRLERLGEGAALRAVRDPIAGTSRKFAPGVAEELVRELLAMRTVDATGRMAEIEGQYVEPVQLQVVCVTLWSTLEPDVTDIQESHLKNFNVNEALSDFYKSAIESAAKETGVPETKLRNWFGKVLITPMGTRSTVFRSEHSTGGVPNSTVDFLESRHIIRAEIRAGARWYELTHDRLVEPILASNQKWLETLSPLQRQATLWNDQGKQEAWLFSGNALADVEHWAKEHEKDLTHVEREFLEACREHQEEIDQKRELETQQQKLIAEQKLTRQRRIIANLSIVATVITLALAVFGFVQAGEANRQTDFAKTEQARAVANENAAKTAQFDAQDKQILALNNAATAVANEQMAKSQALSAQSEALLDKDFQLALLLGIEANAKSSTVQSRGFLLNSAQANPQLMQYLTGSSSSVSAVAFSPDGKTLVSVSDDNMVEIWDMEGGEPIGQQSLASPSNSIKSLAFNADGPMLASAGSDGVISLWDVRSGSLVGQLQNDSAISSLAFSPDGKILASGNFDQTLSLWDLNTLQRIGQPLSGFNDTVTSIAISPDNAVLAWGGCSLRLGDSCSRGHVILWDLVTFEMTGEPIVGHTNFVTGISFSPDGRTLISGSDDKTLILWDMEKRQPIGRPLAGHTRSITGVAFSPDGNMLVSGSSDGNIILWNLTTHLSIGQTLTGHSDSATSAAFSPDGKVLASAGYDNTILLWDVQTSQIIGHPLTGHESVVSSIAFSPDGETLASGSWDNSIRLWNVESGNPTLRQSIRTADAVTSVAFSPDGDILASGSCSEKTDGNCTQGEVVLWDAATGQEMARFSGHTAFVSSIAFSPDGTKLASSGYDTSIVLWDVEARQPIDQSFAGHTDIVTSVAFSPDGKTLASGSWDSTIILWDVEGGQQAGQPLSGHADAVNSVAFSPDGKTLASGSWDYTIILWDVETRQQVGQPLSGHVDAVASVVFSPDGETLASGSYDSTIVLWDIDMNSLVERSCQRAGRNFTRAEWERYFPIEEYRKTCGQWLLEPEATPTPSPVETQTVESTATVTPVPATPTAVFAAPTPTPILFRVVNVTDEDRLNIRAGPGIRYEVIGKIPKDGTGILITGEGVQADNTIWVPIVYNGISGWVNSFYLSRQQ